MRVYDTTARRGELDQRLKGRTPFTCRDILTTSTSRYSSTKIDQMTFAYDLLKNPMPRLNADREVESIPTGARAVAEVKWVKVFALFHNPSRSMRRIVIAG